MCSWKPHVCAVSPAESSLMEQVERILWAGAGAPEGVNAGGRWGPMARRDFFAIFFWRVSTCFHVLHTAVAWQTVNELACGESGIVHGAKCIAVLNGVA